MPVALVNGLDVYYEDIGHGTPVLFIHGGFGGVESALYPQPSVFREVLPAERYRVITYDRRNAGRSGFSRKPYKIEDLGHDAAALLDSLGLERAIVVGDSLGGMVAQRFALRWPERVIGLVLAETAATLIPKRPGLSATIMASKVVPPRMVYRFFKRRVLNPPRYAPVGPATREPEEVRDQRWTEYLQTLREMPGQQLYNYSVALFRTYAAFYGRDFTAEVPRLATLPVHILHGTADDVVPFEAGVKLHELIRGAELHSIDGAGHGLFYYEAAREVCRDVVDRIAAAAGPRRRGWDLRED